MLSKTKVKYIQSLSHKKFRDEYGVFVVEGPKIVEEFLNLRPEWVNEVFGLEQWMDSRNNLLRLLPEGKINIIELSDLEKISTLSSPNQVVAIIDKIPDQPTDSIKNQVVLLLDGIQDPGNLGTIIRTADWFGISRIYCSETCAEKYNPKVIQASMGSLLRVNVEYADLQTVIKKYSDVAVYAATLKGENLFDIAIGEAALIIIGNESRGIGPELILAATHLITIPGSGKAESLNAAVATGIILSRFCRINGLKN